jgi:hypothetical protein
MQFGRTYEESIDRAARGEWDDSTSNAAGLGREERKVTNQAGIAQCAGSTGRVPGAASGQSEADLHGAATGRGQQ